MVELAVIETAPLISEFSAPAKRALAARAFIRRYPAGRALWRAGEPITCLAIILEGRVRVVREEAGRQHVVHTEGVGGTLGEVPLFAGGNAPATAIALVPTRCLLLPRAALEAAIAAEPSVAWILLARLATRVRVMIARLDSLAFNSVSARLAGFLLTRVTQDNRDVALGMTQTALAEELGTVREVVVRALRAFKSAGLIEQRGRATLTVTDIDGLRKISNSRRE